ASLFGEPLRFTRTLSGDEESPPLSLTLENRNLEIKELPAAARLIVMTAADDSEMVYSGTASAPLRFEPESHIPYLFIINAADSDGNTAEYRFLATFLIRPTFAISHNQLLSGGSFVIEVSGVRESDSVTCEYSFDYSPVFTYLDGVYSALVPISHVMKSGDYTLKVMSGEYSETFIISVTEDDYEVQNLEITGDGAAANTAEANREYAETMYALFETVDPTIYWEGLFVQPVSGVVTTPYGVYRYTNGSTTATRHAGVDIANAEGTGIVAPNNGKVIYSGFLTLSGNTILIEHGMGLHTLYMHMEERVVETGDFVEKAQLIGTVGTTGYSTGPHLHYQMMIRDYSINPWFAQDGRAGFFAAGG
ncbi:MAG: M23 family metallopeptidase, partial [Oscillospiraceae bacterium]|nr:M23 family metallopeptidase [Oscillospiraceae bacterium]